VFRRGLCWQCHAEKTRRRGTTSAMWHIALLIGGIYVFVSSSATTKPIAPLAFILLALAFYDVVLIVVTVVHETAHALTAILFEFGVREVSIGVGPRMASKRIGHTRLVFNLYPAGGHTLTLPHGDNLRPKMLAVTAAGPLSHIPLAAWLATVSTGDELWDVLIRSTPEVVMFYFLINVIPIFDNDGRGLARLFTMSDDQLRAMSSAVSSIAELVPTLDDPVANPPTRAQRNAMLQHLQAPGLSPSDRAFALNNLAVVDVLLDDPELLLEADAASWDAFELMPEQPALRNTRGAVLILKGEYAEGIDLMKPTMTKIPAESLGESHLDLAFGYVRLGQAFEGRDHLYAALRRNARPRLFAETLRHLGDLETAVIRQFLEPGEDPATTAARFRRAAGPQAAITGQAIKAHISATGEDTDLWEIGHALSPE